MEIALIHDEHWGAWFWHLKSERLAHGPFYDQLKAKQDATRYYEGANLVFTVEYK